MESKGSLVLPTPVSEKVNTEERLLVPQFPMYMLPPEAAFAPEVKKIDMLKREIENLKKKKVNAEAAYKRMMDTMLLRGISHDPVRKDYEELKKEVLEIDRKIELVKRPPEVTKKLGEDKEKINVALIQSTLAKAIEDQLGGLERTINRGRIHTLKMNPIINFFATNVSMAKSVVVIKTEDLLENLYGEEKKGPQATFRVKSTSTFADIRRIACKYWSLNEGTHRLMDKNMNELSCYADSFEHYVAIASMGDKGIVNKIYLVDVSKIPALPFAGTFQGIMRGRGGRNNNQVYTLLKDFNEKSKTIGSERARDW